MHLPLETLIDLQLHGVNGELLEPGRRGGAGPAYSRAFMLNEHCVMLPIGQKNRAYNATREGDDYTLRGERGSVCAALVAQPKFYDLHTADGIPYRNIALLHGKDCLASTVLQHCSRYADPDLRCRFCSLGSTLESGATILRKTPEQLAEVAEAAMRLDGVTHVTLTSGTTARRDSGILYLGRCAQAVTARTGLPVQIQFEPPEDLALLSELREMGVASVSMHVESLDEEVRRTVTPGKAEIPLDQYFSAFEQALKIFGRNKVNTYVILALGEDQDLTLRQTLRLVKMGVYPNLVPLHHHPGTALAESPNLDAAYLLKVYSTVGEALRNAGMSGAASEAGCGRCGACSLLQFTEVTSSSTSSDVSSPLVKISVAATPEDVEACHFIRRKVFCEEQGIFDADDTDGRDADAVHILARVNGEPTGTVRCFRRKGDVWVGGRLAVLKNFRGNLGAKLVRKAVSIMEERTDVRRFFAIIQTQNLHFFKLLRWRPIGRAFVCNGKEHQVVERPLHVKEIKHES